LTGKERNQTVANTENSDRNQIVMPNGVKFILPSARTSDAESWVCQTCYDLGIVRILKFSQHEVYRNIDVGHRERLYDLFRQHAHEHDNTILKELVQRLKVDRITYDDAPNWMAIAPVEAIRLTLLKNKPASNGRKLNFEGD
jgi:hypothetical protein